MAKTLQCVICGKIKRVRQIVKHKNLLLNDDAVICTDCANDIGKPEHKDELISLCQLMNIPYVDSMVKEVFDDGKLFTDYLKKIAPSKKYVTFLDSEFEVVNQVDKQNDFQVTDEIEQKWGAGYQQDEYYNFELSLKRLTNIKTPNTQFELMRYIQNVKLQTALDQSLKLGDSNAIQKLRKSYSEDLKDLGLDSVLNAADDGMKTLGQRIKDWENNEPIPEKKSLEDVDNIKEYISKWFVIPMKRVFGLADESEVNELYDDGA
ncbi:hypothetical protein [Liquorilactobacillus mali]|uniref:Uncharacterized protein n=1 Tax=Liquorilactobacillus mali KCTC 3596 = DSM 20444 TaxID=1046596 RepID=A0A0R2E5A5_9LACO|nr:hypothetical protein [Liquorilactobacillus mali]KRN10819.1 hypothetical protein FD00_GL002062 [Liquorilactobacillus mali KCTC 3596 = DSM 20444]